MQHSFDIAIATKYGINVATFLNNLAFWIQKNIANNKNYHDDHHWTYNSQEAFLQLFPYWSRQNLRTVLKKCIDEGLILIGNYNETKYDRKGWYAFTDKGLGLFPLLKSLGCNQPMESLKPTTSLVRINQPIADSNTDINTDKREHTRKKRVSLPENYIPSKGMDSMSHDVANKCNTSSDTLLHKFKCLMKSSGKVSADWDAEYGLFLSREKPEKINNTPSFDKKNETRSTVQVYKDPYDYIKRASDGVVNENMNKIKQLLSRKIINASDERDTTRAGR